MSYAAAAAEVLAPVAVNIGIEAATAGYEVTALIDHVAVYRAKLPAAGQMIFAQRAGDAIEYRDLGAAGWAGRRIMAAIEAANGAGEAHTRVQVENVTPTVSASANVELAV